MNEIPSSKVERAGKFMKTGLKVGGNYIKHYAKKLVNSDTPQSELDRANAADIYEALSELKGSALKAAQMLSMDQSLLPKEYTQKFAEAQYNAPALSGPLVVKTFERHFGKSPFALYDSFELQAVHAASIGQVHKATKYGKDLAVKIQYPGVGDSVISDLNLVKPVAKRLFGWKDKDIDMYFQEVQERLVEETDYLLEQKRGIDISQKCAHIANLTFPTYFPELCSQRIITMEWVKGMHLEAFLATNPSQEICNTIGQALWDFYNFQIHHLQQMHADAHPGNYLFQENGQVCILDFGCVKVFPQKFITTYRQVLEAGVVENDALFRKLCIEMEAIRENEPDKALEAKFLELIRGGIKLLCLPFHTETFDFADEAYFTSLYAYGKQASENKELRSSAPRGTPHAIYMNRTYFGLFSILHELKANICTRNFL